MMGVLGVGALSRFECVELGPSIANAQFGGGRFTRLPYPKFFMYLMLHGELLLSSSPEISKATSPPTTCFGAAIPQLTAAGLLSVHICSARGSVG